MATLDLKKKKKWLPILEFFLKKFLHKICSSWKIKVSRKPKRVFSCSRAPAETESFNCPLEPSIPWLVTSPPLLPVSGVTLGLLVFLLLSCFNPSSSAPCLLWISLLVSWSRMVIWLSNQLFKRDDVKLVLMFFLLKNQMNILVTVIHAYCISYCLKKDFY